MTLVAIDSNYEDISASKTKNQEETVPNVQSISRECTQYYLVWVGP